MATVIHQFEWYRSVEGVIRTDDWYRTEEDGSEIYVTGTFDSWSKSVQLAKDPVTGRYIANVALPVEHKVLYKVCDMGLYYLCITNYDSLWLMVYGK